MILSVVWLKAGDKPIIAINAILGQPIAGFLGLPRVLQLHSAHPSLPSTVDLIACLKGVLQVRHTT